MDNNGQQMVGESVLYTYIYVAHHVAQIRCALTMPDQHTRFTVQVTYYPTASTYIETRWRLGARCSLPRCEPLRDRLTDRHQAT